MKKTSFTLLLALLLNMFGFKAYAGFNTSTKVQVGTLYYYLDNANCKAEVTSMPSGKYTGSISISSFDYEGKNYIVTSIGNYAFDGCKSLTSIIIPNSVTTLGHYAFRNCQNLTSISIPNSMTSIGERSFFGCAGLTSINIPSSVTSIGLQAFKDCTGLASITIPNSVTSIGGEAFDNTAWYKKQPDGLLYLGKVAYKYKGTMPKNTSITIEDGTQGIGGAAFIYCSDLISITIPNSVTNINSDAFWGCSSLTSITIPNSVTSIGSGVFNSCSSLTSVTIPNSVMTIGNGAFYNSAWYNNQPDGLVYAGKVAYKYKGTMPENTSITIEDGTLGIGEYAFYEGCANLKSITIPNSVTNIGKGAFVRCLNLTSITIPNSVTNIGDYVFESCTRLTSVIIGNSVTSIGLGIFNTCKNLTSVTVLNSTPADISEGVFPNRTNATLYVPKGSKEVYEAADYWKDFKEIIEIDPAGIEQITGSENGKAMIFTIDGKRVDDLKKGLNVIRMKDGKMRKVVVK